MRNLVGVVPAGLVGLWLGWVLVAAVHARSRSVGAVSAVGWCLAAAVFAELAHAAGAEVAVLGIRGSPRLFFLPIVGILAFNVTQVLRALRLRWLARQGRRTDPPPAATSPTSPAGGSPSAPGPSPPSG